MFRNALKKKILVLALLTVGAGLLALLVISSRNSDKDDSLPKWHRVAVSKKGSIYLDSQSVKKVGEHIQVQALNEIAETEVDIAVSVISIEEVDCRAQKSRTLSYVAYPGPMGAGEPLTSVSEPEDWSSAGPNTTQEAMIKLMCEVQVLIDQGIINSTQ